MPSVLPGYEYDIFISYRQKDNKYDGWVTEFVSNLQKELEATFKEDISIYFDENPHDGLLETHDVDDSLRSKLKCLIFIPILSRTYCDPNCFAWRNEFAAFNAMAATDVFGSQITLRNGNISGRVLPIRIHELEMNDIQLVEQELKRKLRPIDFIFKAPGVNRPLRAKEDNPKDNLEKTFYRDQINKVANAISEIIGTMKRERTEVPKPLKVPVDRKVEVESGSSLRNFINELSRRNIFRAALAYCLVSIVVIQVTFIGQHFIALPEWLPTILMIIVAVLFPLALIFAWFYEVSPKGFIRIDSSQSKENPYTAAQKKPFTGNMIMLIFVLLFIIQNLYINKLEKMPARIGLTGDKSVLVLPFENRGESPNEYFAEELTEDINALLSRINQLRVISSAASRSYKGTKQSYTKLAGEMGVSYVLSGSIQLLGNQVRVAPELIDGKTNNYLWGDVFVIDQKDLFSVLTEIAQRVASALNISLSTAEMKHLSKRPTNSFSAYDYYLKGRNHYYKYKAEENELAISYFRRAIATDPNFALAWAGLGDAYNQSFGWFAKGDPHLSDSAMYASKKAIQLDSSISEGYKSLASTYYYLTKYDSSTILLNEAVKRNPNNIAAVGNLGTNYFMGGQFAEAIRFEKKSAGLNPKNYIPYQIVGWSYRLMGDYDNAEIWLKKSLEIQPDFVTYELLAYTYVCQGRKGDALELIPNLLKLDENDPLVVETAGLIANFAGETAMAKTYFKKNMEAHTAVNQDPQFTGNIHLGQIYLLENNKVDAEVLLTTALELNLAAINQGSLDRSFPFNIAGLYAIRGKPYEAINWLDKAIAVKWMDYAMITHGPWFVSMREHPELRKRVDMLKTRMEQMRKEAEVRID
jgi:TolB-like protein/Flp pilus assembly protein TadD